MINDALHQVRNDARATLFGLDPRGYCFVAEVTQKSVLHLWQQFIGHHTLQQRPGTEQARAEMPEPNALPGNPSASQAPFVGSYSPVIAPVPSTPGHEAVNAVPGV